MFYINGKNHLLKILKFLLEVDDVDVIKFSLESLIESLEDDDDDEGEI